MTSREHELEQLLRQMLPYVERYRQQAVGKPQHDKASSLIARAVRAKEDPQNDTR